MLDVTKLMMNCKINITDMCFLRSALTSDYDGSGPLLTVLVISATPYPAVPMAVTISRVYAPFSRTLSIGKSEMSSPL